MLITPQLGQRKFDEQEFKRFNNNMCRRIKYYLKKKHITLRQVAERTKKTHTEVCNLLGGKSELDMRFLIQMEGIIEKEIFRVKKLLEELEEYEYWNQK